MKYFNRTLISFLAVGLVLAATGSGILYYLATTFTDAELKALVIEEVKATTGRVLVINGDVAIVPGLTPSISLRSLTLPNAPWGTAPYTLKAKELEAGLALAPLLAGRLKLQYLHLRNVDLVLETDPEGRNNWDFEAVEPSASLTRRDALRDGLVSLVSLAQHFDFVAIEDLNVRRLNRLRGVERSVALSNVVVEAQDQDRHIAVALQGQEGDRVISLRADLENATPYLDGDKPLFLKLFAEASTWSLEAEGHAIPEETDARLGLTVAFQGEALRKMIGDLDDFFNLPALPPLPEIMAFRAKGRLTGPLKNPALENLVADMTGSEESSVRLKGTIMEGETAPILDLEVQALLNDFASFGRDVAPDQFDWSWPGLADQDALTFSGKVKGTPRALSLSDVRLAWGRKNNLRITMSGTADDLSTLANVTGSLTLEGVDSPEVRRLVERIAPTLPTETTATMGRFEVSGDITRKEGRMTLGNARGRLKDFHDIKTSFNAHWASSNDFSAEGVVESRGDSLSALIDDVVLLAAPDSTTTPSTSSLPYTLKSRFTAGPTGLSLHKAALFFGRSIVNGDFSATQMDVRPMFAADVPEASLAVADLRLLMGLEEEATSPSPATPFFSERHLMDIFGDWDATLRFSGEVLGKDAPLFSELLIEADTHAGKVGLSSFSAITEFGRISASGTWAQDKLDLAASVNAVNLGSVLSRAGIADWLIGAPLSGTLLGRATGASAHDLATTFSGRVKVSVGPGVVHNANMDWLAGDMLTNLYGELNAFSHDNAQSDLTCAAANLTFKDGKAHFEKGLALETTKIALLGSGEIDLGAEKLDVLLASAPKEGLGLSLSGSGRLAKLSGTLSEPTLAIDEMAVVRKGLSAGAAYLSGGLSMIFETLFNWMTADKTPCQTVLTP